MRRGKRVLAVVTKYHTSSNGNHHSNHNSNIEEAVIVGTHKEHNGTHTLEGNISRKDETHHVKATLSVDPDKGYNQYNPWLDQEGYQEYVKKHGHHFNRELAIWASNQLTNDDMTEYHASPEFVKSLWVKHKLDLPQDSTWGDVTYAYNLGYSDFYPDPLKTEYDLVKHSYKDVVDIDGYSGKIFNHWLSDIVNKRIKVPWEELS